MFRDDRSYFRRRAAEEAVRAETAAHPQVAFVHHRLAQAYLTKAAAASSGTAA